MSQTPTESGGILVPVDFSPSSLAALLWGARAAESFGLPLEVLHVVHDPASAPGYYRAENGTLERLEEAASQMMETFMEDVLAKYPDCEALQRARRTLVIGLPVARILEVARASGARQIVMGSQGRSGLPRLLLGSKAQQVVQQAQVPVTIVKAGSAPSAGGEA